MTDLYGDEAPPDLLLLLDLLDAVSPLLLPPPGALDVSRCTEAHDFYKEKIIELSKR